MENFSNGVAASFSSLHLHIIICSWSTMKIEGKSMAVAVQFELYSPIEAAPMQKKNLRLCGETVKTNLIFEGSSV